jgi:threonine/homoserine/homoserine lactone efflux protein
MAGDTAYAILAGQARNFLSKSRIRVIETASGLFLIAGGLWLALRGR